jgi:DNA modification methylase
VIHTGDCVQVMAELPADSVDAIVTDPPYNLGFMGKAWDSKHQHEPWAREAFRVAKPGAHLLAFGGTRTYHRLAAAIEDAGWEIRDCLVWAYASGFPKSLNIGNGMGTALKPAWEPIVMARKPLRGTVAANVLAHGTGALNIGATRIGYANDADRDQTRVPIPIQHNDARGVYQSGTGVGRTGEVFEPASAGRWPANLLLTDPILNGHSRFFLIPKSSRSDREPVLRGQLAEAVVNITEGHGREGDGTGIRINHARENAHPTVKPIDLMRHLVRLVTPPGGTVLDCFLGSGTTAIAAEMEGFAWIGIEKEAEYVAIAEARLNGVQKGLAL